MTDITDFRIKSPDHRYWKYVDSSDAMKSDYPKKIKKNAAYKTKLQKKILDSQVGFEAEARKITDKHQLGEFLSRYTQKWVASEEF